MDHAITWSFERERHQLKHNTKPNSLSVGDVVIIKSDERDRNQWPMGVVEELFIGRDCSEIESRQRIHKTPNPTSLHLVMTHI